MKEKLSVKKVYRNAFRYVLSHLPAFIFLTVFYFAGSLVSMQVRAFSFRVITLLYGYLFFYFAAGFYYKQKLLFEKEVFIAAGIRFLSVVVLFLTALLASTVMINFVLYFARTSFLGSETIINLVLGSVFWLIGKYLFIFMLFVVFFIVPSFTFVSEITGKSRSLLNAYAKAKGNIFHIGLTAVCAVLALIVAMAALSFANLYIAEVARSGVLVFISIVYFKMYDFLYDFSKNKRIVAKAAETGGQIKIKNIKDNPNTCEKSTDAKAENRARKTGGKTAGEKEIFLEQRGE